MRWMILALLLSGCASPTRRLYDSVQVMCPQYCGAFHWTGAIYVSQDFITCDCDDKALK